MRWATDLGMDSYGLKGYWDWGATGSRWAFWRCNGHSHNLCLLDGRDLTIHSRAEITRCSDGVAIAELSDAYRGQGVTAARRGLRLVGGTVQVRDEFVLERPARIAWGLTTAAVVRIADDGRSALLERDGRTMLLVLQAPAPARFAVTAAPPPPPGGNSNAAYRRITCTIDATGGGNGISVSFLAGSSGPLPEPTELDAW